MTEPENQPRLSEGCKGKMETIKSAASLELTERKTTRFAAFQRLLFLRSEKVLLGSVYYF